MLLKVERLNHTGDGIAIYDNIVYFIPKVIPGDVISVLEEDIVHYKNYNRVVKYKIVEKSKYRVPILCPYYDTCGGCQLMGLSYEEQLLYKKNKIKDIFRKYASLDIHPEIIKTSLYQYRNKITFHVKDGIVGLYEENSNNIVTIDKCLLISDKLNYFLSIFKKLDLSNVYKIILKMIQNDIMIQFLGIVDNVKVIDLLKDNVSSIYVNDHLIYGVSQLKERLLSYEFYVSPNSFFQVNKEGTEYIYRRVKKYLGMNHSHVLDLYCGTGTIGICISDCCRKVTGIEINQSSVEDARKNIKLNGIKNMKIIQGSVDKILKVGEVYDAIIVDPPRSGLGKKVVDTLLQIKSSKIIYISCNPITLARDINLLKELYCLSDITLVDMFPNTYHCESVCILERK